MHTISIIHSDVNATIDKEWIASFRSVEKNEVLADKQKIAEYTEWTTLKNTDHPIDDSLEIWRFDGDIDLLIARYRNSKEKSYMEKASEKAEKAYLEKNRITLDTLLLQMKGNQPQQILKISDYLLLYPDEAQKLLPVIKNADSETAASLIYVLQRTGTHQAQEVLKKIVQDEEYGQRNRSRAIIALGGVKEPTDGTIDFLWETSNMRDTAQNKLLSDTAVLNVGRFGKDSPYANDIREKLQEMSQNIPEDSYHKKIVLLSMKNADAQYFETEIFDALTSNNPDVKSAAIKALTGQNRDTVRDKLLPLFNTSEDFEVRQQLAKTLLTIDPNDALMSRARENLLKDDDNLVRKSLILYLLKYKGRYPENDNTLKELRKTERDKDNQILLIKNGY